MQVSKREGDVCDTAICVRMHLCVCDRDSRKGDPGPGEDTGVLVMEGAWEKAGNEGRGEQPCGQNLTFEPLHLLGTSQDPSAATRMCLDVFSLSRHLSITQCL